MATSIEIERKYALPVRFRLPDLRHVPGVGSVDGADDLSLDATYYDTADLRLAAHRVTLRRRTGGHDAGWHLKRPAGAHRSERSEPLSDELPAVLAGQVRAIVRNAPLVPVARLRTRRRERSVYGMDGAVLALIADDSVTAEDLTRPDRVERWRELEVELVGGPPELLDAIDEALWAAGAQPADSPSKLARALGDRMPAVSAPTNTGQPVADYLRAQRDELVANDPLVRDEDPDGVHDMRVAVRRTRATLRSFRRLLDRAAADALGGELRWLAGQLGAVRDSDVLTERFRRALDGLAAGDEVGPVRARVAERLRADADVARAALAETLDSDRYLAILDAYDEFVGRLPDRLPPRRLRGRARHALERADRRLDDATFARRRGFSGADAMFHDARKAYKRARYAVELVRPVVGRPAEKLAARLTALQDVLGAHQDAAVAAIELRELATDAAARGEDGYTYGLLRARELEEAERRLDEVPCARRRAGRSDLRAALAS